MSIDLFGPLPNKKHVLVVQDTMPRFPAAALLPSTKAEPVIKAIATVYTAYGVPERHRTDNGPPFNSREFREFSKSKGIEVVHAYPYHPQGNPREILMKPLGKAMKASHFEGENPQVALDNFLSSYRATLHPATEIAPGDILLRYGYKSGFPAIQNKSDYQVEQGRTRDKQHKGLETKSTNESKKQKAMSIEIGDKVLIRDFVRKSKFAPAYIPEVFHAMELDDKGVVVMGRNVDIRRRHTDDVKIYFQEREQCGEANDDLAESKEEIGGNASLWERDDTGSEVNTEDREEWTDEEDQEVFEGDEYVDGKNNQEQRQRRPPAWHQKYVME